MSERDREISHLKDMVEKQRKIIDDQTEIVSDPECMSKIKEEVDTLRTGVANTLLDNESLRLTVTNMTAEMNSLKEREAEIELELEQAQKISDNLIEDLEEINS